MRTSVLAAVVLSCVAALAAAPAFAQPHGPPPPPPDDGGYGPPPNYGQPPPGPYAPPEPAPPFERQGWFAGFGLGVGGVSSGDGSDQGWGGGQMNGYFGGLINPRVALVVEVALGAYQRDSYYYDDYNYEPRQINLATVTLGGQFFIGDNLWLRAGLGSTHRTLIDAYDYELGSDEGRTFSAALGWEIIQRTSFALDLNLGFAATNYDSGGYLDENTSAISLGVGFSWY